MLVKPHAGQPANIKVIGIGGGGGNALNTMINEEDISGVEFIVMNTDAQALLNHQADVKIQIGEALTKGLGSGGDPEVGREAAEESRENIRAQLEGADMVFIAAGEGGGTGTGAAPIVAEISREIGALTVAVVNKPFMFEGSRRQHAASEGIDKLREHVDTLIVIPNQKVLELVDEKMTMVESFKKINSVLHQGVKGIAELITTPGLINVDFADVRTIMREAGTALMGIGSASGENRTTQAIKQAISSPLVESSISGAKGVLFNIVGGEDLSMAEVNAAAEMIAKSVDPDADIIFGAVIKPEMNDEVRVTVIATRIEENRHHRMPRAHGVAPKPFLRRPNTSFQLDVNSHEEDSAYDEDSYEEPIEEHEEVLDLDDRESRTHEVEQDEDTHEFEETFEDVDFDDSKEFDTPAFMRRKN